MRHIYAVLTVRQRQTLEAIRAFIARRGYSPTLRELAAEMELSSAGTVRTHVLLLERWGFIERGAGSARTIRINPEERVAEIQAARHAQ